MNKSYYIFTQGKLSRKENTISFTPKGGEKKIIPIEIVADLYIMVEMELNTSLLNLLSQYGVTVHFFNYYNFYIGSFYPKEKLLAGQLLVRQVEAYTNNAIRLGLAKQFVEAAAFNMYRNLRYYNGRGKELGNLMNQIQHLMDQIEPCESINELMGVEGNIKKTYYESFETIIDQPIEFEKRVKYPPDNMMNSLISYMNMLIYTKVLSEIYVTQLNPTISYLHEPGVRRFSLSLDIAEIFKPLIGDRLLFSLLNRGQITEKSFTRELNCLHLTKKGSQTILGELDKRLKDTIQHKDLGKKVSYQYLMRLECYKLIKHIMGEKAYKGFKIWW